VVVIIVSAVLLLGAGVFFAAAKKWFGLGIYNAIWAVTLISCSSDLVQPHYRLVLTLICVSVIAVNLGYLLSKYLTPEGLPVPQKHDGAIFNSRLLIGLMGLAVAIMAVFAVKSLMKFGFDLAAIRAANNSVAEGSVFSSRLDSVLFYGYAMPMIYVGAFCLAFNFSQKKKISFLLLGLELAAVVLNVLAVAGRSVFIRVILILFAAILWRLGTKGGFGKKVIISVLAIGILFYGVMEITTLMRNDWEVSFFQQAMNYIRGAVSHMQYRLGHLPERCFRYGFVTYGGFLYYPLKVLSVFGIDLNTSNDIMFFMQEYVDIAVGNRTMHYNALAPNVFYYFFDSGWYGVVAFSLLLGFSAGRSEGMRACPRFFEFVLWATAVYAIVYSPMDGVLWAFRFPTAIIYCLLLKDLLYVPADCGRIRKWFRL